MVLVQQIVNIRKPSILLMEEIRRSPVEVGSEYPIIYRILSTIPGG